MDEIVRLMIQNGVKVDGDLNYILFKFCAVAVHPGYGNYKNFCGELSECVAEVRKRLTAKYLDQKIQENGDVP